MTNEHSVGQILGRIFLVCFFVGKCFWPIFSEFFRPDFCGIFSSSFFRIFFVGIVFVRPSVVRRPSVRRSSVALGGFRGANVNDASVVERAGRFQNSGQSMK